MEKVRYKRKSNLKIIFGLTIMIIIIIITLLIVSKNFSNSNQESQVIIKYINDNSWDSEVIVPRGITNFMENYRGELSQGNIGKSLYVVINQIFPEYYSELYNLNEDGIKEYYKNNYKKIKTYLGIESEKMFVKVIDNLKNTQLDNLVLQYYYIDSESIKNADNYTTATIYISYKNGILIPFEIKVNNRTSNESLNIMYVVK